MYAVHFNSPHNAYFAPKYKKTFAADKTTLWFSSDSDHVHKKYVNFLYFYTQSHKTQLPGSAGW